MLNGVSHFNHNLIRRLRGYVASDMGFFKIPLKGPVTLRRIASTHADV